MFTNLPRKLKVMAEPLTLIVLLLGTMPAPAQQVYVVPGLGNTTGSRLTVEEARTAVKMHDTARAAVGITKKMEWSNDLAAYAQAWADQLVRNGDGKIPHNPENKYGECIYWGSGELLSTVVAAVSSWESEKKDYQYGEFTGNEKPIVGHYTQMVWQETTRLGMGKAYDAKNNKTYFVCNYDPKGNFIGKKPYVQTGKPTPSPAATTKIRVQFTNRTDQEVTFFLNGGTGLTTRLKAGQTEGYTMVVDPGVAPIVGIFQADGKRLDFTVANDQKYAFKLEDGKIKNFFD